MSIEALVAASRLLGLRKACAASLAPLFPEVEVREHIGKLDVSDLVSKEFVAAPAILVAATRASTVDRLSHDRDRPVKMSAYVIAEDQAFGAPPRRFDRDEIGYALGEAVLAVLQDDGLSRWGLADLGYPEEPELAPLFTMKTFERGVVVYAVSWQQTLYDCGAPYLDMDSGLGSVTALYPGDPTPEGGLS